MLNYMLGYAINPPTVVHVPDRSLPSAEDIMLRARVDALELAFAGLWRILKEQGLTEEQLVAKMEEADMADGVRDGKVRSQIETCPSCNHKLLSRKSKKCLWCGADLPASVLS